MSKSSWGSNEKNSNFSEKNSELESESAYVEESAKLPSTQPYAEQEEFANKLKGYKDKIYSIAILLTGSIEDAEEVVEEVFEQISFNLGEIESESMETTLHRLTYDASLLKLLHQVDNKVADLEETGSKILKLPTYLC